MLNEDKRTGTSPRRAAGHGRRYRYTILLLVFLATVLNYVDRTNISIAAPDMKHALHLNPVEMGLALSAFGWAYAAMQIPGGLLVDRFGTRRAYGIAMVFWSVVSVLTGFARGFGTLFAARLGLGITESPAFPANNRMVARWFPAKERGKATSVYVSGEYVGQGFLLVLLAWIVATFSWQTVFIATGAVGLVFAAFWFRLAHEPDEPRGGRRASADTLDPSARDARPAGRPPLRLRDIKVLLASRQMWGIYIGQFAINAVLWFFLTWFPSYLVSAKGFTLIKAGIFASIPFIAGFLGVLASGWFSDWLIRRGVSLSKARKGPIIIGLLLAATIVLANYTQSPTLVITIMTFAFFAQGVSHISWALVAETAPTGLLGLAGGVFNLAGNIASFVIPIVFGIVLQTTRSFNGGLLFIAVVAVIGALSYMFLVGKVHRLQLDHDASSPLTAPEHR